MILRTGEKFIITEHGNEIGDGRFEYYKNWKGKVITVSSSYGGIVYGWGYDVDNRWKRVSFHMWRAKPVNEHLMGAEEL